MAFFNVQGLTPQGQLERRRIQAGSAEEACRLVQPELQVLSVSSDSRISLSWHRSGFDLFLFARELMTLLQAGLSLIEALSALNERQQADDTLAQLIRHLQQGLSFSGALGRFPAIFPDLFVASMAASEQTGDMVDALQRFLRYQEQVGIVRNKIISAAVYPALLLLVGGAVAIFLLCYLVPRFSHIYEGLDTELPLASRLLMEWGAFASHHALAVSLGLVGLVVSVIILCRQPATWARLLAVAQRQPWLGERLRLLHLSRFYRALSLLVRGGIPVLKGLQMSRALLPAHLQAALDQVIDGVNTGLPLSRSLQQGGLATSVASRLLLAGERNGQLADMLESTAAFHDQEINRWIDSFTRLFEPLLMLFIGGVIGGIVILLYLPIFELAGSIQ